VRLLIENPGNLPTLAVIVAALIITCVVTYALAQRKMGRSVEALRREMEARMASLPLASPAAIPAPQVSPAPAPMPVQPAAASNNHVTPEVLLMIAAAVTTFLGKKVRIRSAKMLQTPYELFNPWAQQGRVVVQASHNLAQRYRE